MAVNQDKKNKTKDGRIWYFQIYYNDLLGNRKKYKSKKYLTKKEAEEAERNYILTLNNRIPKKNITFKDLMYQHYVFQKDLVKITTYSNYYKMHNQLSSLNKIKVCEFDLSYFNKFKEEINKKDLSISYKNKIYGFLRSLLIFANKYYSINTNDILYKMTGFSNKNEVKKEMLFWTYEEFKKFISKVDDIRYKSYFEILYYCGMRKGEANALNWNDVDLINNKVFITKTVTDKIRGQKYITLPPKTKTSVRTLPISKQVKDTLIALKKYYMQYKNYSDDWFVFGGIVPLPSTTIEKQKNNACKKAQVKQIRIHDFRHSCASLLISKGASVALVSKYLGHADISTTLNTYTHMFKNDLEDLIKELDNL